jgi:hypothetical protein
MRIQESGIGNRLKVQGPRYKANGKSQKAKGKRNE